MKSKPSQPSSLLGIEAGGTRTVALLANPDGKLIKRREFGPGNLRILNDRHLLGLFREIASEFPKISAIGIGMAGLRDPADHARLSRVIEHCWPGASLAMTHDLETGLLAATPDPDALTSVLVLSGTGSCCYGTSVHGKTAKLGGWGHIIGDKGSGYELGLRALKAIVYYLDRDGVWSILGKRILRRLLLNEPNDLIAWVQNASKSDIAALAIEIFAAASAGDKIARDILDGALSTLAKDAVSCAKRLTASGRVNFVLAGSVLVKQPQFAAALTQKILEKWPEAKVQTVDREGAWGAIEMARRLSTPRHSKAITSSKKRAIFVPPLQASKAPTEQRNPRTKNLDKLDTEAAIELLLSEERRVIPALLKEKEKLIRAVDLTAKALASGGRLFYIGAGTSGRLGVLDASECPPTFRSDPEQVQGIIAGGQRALWQAVEGAEDDAEAGYRAVNFRGVRKGDVLVGIAASGRTPFVWGGFAAAKKVKAKSILLCFNPHLVIDPKSSPDLLLAPQIGPESLTGSTRLKSGTATKLVLNLLTTLTMVRLGKVISNLMIDLNPSNVKLRDRAVRIVSELTECSPQVAQAALESHGWIVKAAWQSLQSRSAKSAPAKSVNL